MIERDGHWDGCRPGDADPFPVVLPRLGTMSYDEGYVPTSRSWTGGDSLAVGGLLRRHLWANAFAIGRFSVTNA